MIKNFEPSLPTEPAGRNFQWGAAIGAGLIAGGVLLIVPHGTPWSGIDFFAPVVMGRVIPEAWGVSMFSCYLLHLALAILYSLIISRVVVGVTQLWAVFTGGMVGLFLYGLNLAAVSFLIPDLRGGEFSVGFTHFVFGAIAGGAYRGLLRRRVAGVSSEHVVPPV